MNPRNGIPKKDKKVARMKRKLFIWAAVFQVLTPYLPQTALSETLDEAFKAALAHDYNLKSVDDNVAAAEENLAAARSNRYPSLTAQAGYTVLDNTPTTSVKFSPLLPTLVFPLMENGRFLVSDITLSVPVFTSFKITHGIRAAEAAADAGRAERDTAIQDVKLKTAEAYVTVLRAVHGLSVARSNVTALSAHAKDVTNAYDKGFVPRNDVLSVHVALASARQTEITVENALSLSRAAYNRQLGRPLDSPVDLADPANENPDTGMNDLDSLTQRALSNRSELKGLGEQARIHESLSKSTRAGLLPQILISGSCTRLTHTPLDEETIWSGSVGVRWAIFDGGVLRHQARSDERKRSAAENMKKEAETLVMLQVRQAVLDVTETSKRIAVARDAMAQAEENLKIAKNRYNREIGSNTEVLDAETLRVNSLTNHNNAVYDLVMAKFRLKRATGDL